MCTLKKLLFLTRPQKLPDLAKTSVCKVNHRRTRRGGGGGGAAAAAPPPPGIVKIAIFGGKKNQVIFGQNHWIFGQAMEKIFGQLTSAPLNETGPVTPMKVNTEVKQKNLY